ncbi:MAG TPA: Dethiobiotin synthetase [Halomicronema sp.]|jgi:hypothetical protein
MDYKTARNFLIDQGTALITQKNPDAFLLLLKNKKIPIPGQMTSLLLALKLIQDTLVEETTIDRTLGGAIYLLAIESYRLFEEGKRAGVDWPPLLKEDLKRLSDTVAEIFLGN